MEEMYTLCCTYISTVCAKPHSADVERIISANNVLKSVHRNRMKIINYLFIIKCRILKIGI